MAPTSLRRAVPFAALLALAAVAGPGVATDGLAEFSLKPGGTVASPGETVRLVVFLRSSPQVASGAYEAGFVLAFDASVLRATSVTRGRFMSEGADTTVRTNRSAVDNEAGVVRYGLVRDPPNGGVTGYARFATVTFEVRTGAPAGTSDVSFRRTRVLLTDGGFQRVATYGSTVTVTRAATATPTAPPTTTGGRPPDAAVGAVVVVGAVALLLGVVGLVRRA